jgi:hypothetical protein
VHEGSRGGYPTGGLHRLQSDQIRLSFFKIRKVGQKTKAAIFTNIGNTHFEIECIDTFTTEQKEIYFTLVDIRYIRSNIQ